ncbi:MULTISPECIES: trehalose-6-phosphate synthase [Anaeromyxobacter]|uniref:trehalose-6-phosphate synthase n=1 Tax=Anaeromyxobacter TaxID=161492 RepID=UPI001F59DF9F|nr:MULTISPECIES: trehalose-6-phosphate synthase [unclassified Anaeromyxobacter]
MRAFVRVLLPLVVVLAGLAWAAAALLNGTARAWYEKDVGLRAHLVVAGAREALATHLASGDRRRVGAVLAEIARDDRIMAASVCGRGMRTVARTGVGPSAYECDALGERFGVPAEGERLELDRVEDAEGGLVHFTVQPLLDDDGAVLAHVALVHDLSFVARREAALRRYTAGAFAIVAILASILTVFVRRLSWRTWNEELRRVLTLGRSVPGAAVRSPRKEFQPLLSDVRQLVSDLAAEQGHGTGGRWSAERLHRTLTETLHGEGIVTLANREPYIHDRAPDGSMRVLHPASGLVTALEPVMRACSGVWVAHGSGTADRAAVDGHDRVRVPPGEESYAIRRVWLTPEEERGYYYGFSNEGLWPLCHVAHTRPVFRAQDWREYQRVNRRFAEAVCEEVDGPDPIVLVQDYHFALAPRMIRERLPRATIISFWHVPWPNAERFGICPWANELLDGMLGSSVVGFHTQLHCNNFFDGVDRFLEARLDRERQSVVLGGRESLVRAYPISIDWPNRWAAEAPPPSECRRQVLAELGLPPDAKLGVGVDRLDYTKGIEERLLAVERLLERFPHLRGRFTFVQLSAPSRTLIDKYRELSERVDAIASRVNARFAEGAWRPIALLRAHHEPPTIFRYLRAADVCYVSSLHDGMNLVAKEFVAARDDERGVLVLSRFTGAARELTEALLVNPYDIEEASAALATAIAMPPDEQAARMRAMRAFVADFNVYRWAGRMLVDAARLRQRDRLSTRLNLGLRSVHEVKP